MVPLRLMYKIVLIVVLTQIILDSNNSIKGQAQASDKIPIGVIFDKNTEEIQNAFKFAIMQYSSYDPNHLEFQVFVDVISTADAFKLSRLICNQFSRGVIAMMGAVSPDSFEAFHSYTNTFQIPFVTPWFPEKVLPPSSGYADYALSMRPDYHMAVIEIITYYEWREVIYIYDSHDGLLRLQQLYQSFQPGKSAFQITHVKCVTSATEVVSYLLSIEKLDPWSNKHVVLDSTTEIAKETIILHVRDVHLGRRNYHYLFSGLVLDDHWDKDVEFGAINITGFRVLDYSKKIVRDFFNATRKDTLSAQAALMYDSVQVLVDAIQRLSKKKPDLIRSATRRYSNSNKSRIVDCNPKDKITPYEHGEKISNMIRKTEIEGLTGIIRFNEAGHRKNFCLQIMEFTVKGNMVKIGTWDDNTGFVPIVTKTPKNNIVGLYERKKTYIITTILEIPYMMNHNKDSNVIATELLSGFCVDLANILMDKMEIKYEFRMVRDGKYGQPNPASVGGWDGIIGELIRQEADLAIAPLTNTMERQAVVDFSSPFLSFLMKPKREFVKQEISIFTFFRPLSMEIWYCIILSLLGASMVLYVVTRFSPYERRVVTNSPQAPENTAVARNPREVDGFSFWNSLWFAVSSLLQQGSYMTPRSASGRIVTTAWWTFSFVFVSLYTANMSSYLTFIYMSDSTPLYEKIATCPEDSVRRLTKSDNSQLHSDDQSVDEPCEMLVTIMTPGVQNFAVALPKESKLRAGVNLALQALINEGSLQRLIRKWFTKLQQTLNTQDNNFALTLSDTAGLFFVLMGGLVIALTITLMEYIYYKILKTGHDTVPPTEIVHGQTSHSGHRRRTPPESTPHHQDDCPEWNRGDFPGFYASASNFDQDEMEQPTFSQV